MHLTNLAVLSSKVKYAVLSSKVKYAVKTAEQEKPGTRLHTSIHTLYKVCMNNTKYTNSIKSR